MEYLTLTTDDVDALRALARNKDHAVRHALVADWRIHEGYAITVIETRTMPEGFDPRTIDRRTRIAVNGRTERYIPNADSPRLVASGDAYGVSTPKAIGNLVKAGDMIYVRFYIGNNTEAMKAAGFNHDQCHIEVWRGADAARAKLIAMMPLDDRVYHERSALGGSMRDWSYKPERDGASA